MSISPSRIATQLRLPRDLYEKSKYISEQELRSLNNLFELAIQKYIEGYESKHGVIPLDDGDSALN